MTKPEIKCAVCGVVITEGANYTQCDDCDKIYCVKCTTINPLDWVHQCAECRKKLVAKASGKCGQDGN